ncbi:beta-glucosidase 12 [Cryptomeria japonica]|uniref:beta-glucosidase 12 n=1 Tax=Cryptomeria japonica TaxID=3369 RepID=UPI0025AC2EEE|nr:beta-glucosidase 12 [Cryptomeria japonica]
MASGSRFCVLVTVLCCTWSFSVRGDSPSQTQFGRKSFPSDFVFGLGSAPYQYEGAAKEDGRGISIWDTFSHTPGKIADGSNGDVANDQYHRYKEDIKLLVDLGVKSYRFSIAWPRIYPKGRGIVNRKGIIHYNNLIDELLKNGIEPLVTIFHWDLPQVLQDEYGGFLSEKIVKDFVAYADTCFEAFGDRVKKWVTLNEPLSIVLQGYNTGNYAPGRCSKSIANCTEGDSATEPYIVAHNFLLSHAAAVKLYRDKYQKKQKGSIGISLITPWFIPYTNSLSDQKATRRILDFYFGWFMDPITSGDYPTTMRSYVGTRLPHFTLQQSKLLKGSFDFVGINYYTAYYALNNNATPNATPTDFTADYRVNFTGVKNGILIGAQAGSSWLYVYPRGIRALLNFIKVRYGNPPIYITENGVDEKTNASKPLKESLNDTWRIESTSKHLLNLFLALRDGCNVLGYYGWTFLDDFEWDSGYSLRFGFYFVDRLHNFTRYPKASAYWLKDFLHH